MFCQSCGTPLPTQLSGQPSTPATPSIPAPAPYYTLPPRRGMRSEEKTIIIIIVLVGILVIGIIASAFIFFSPLNLSRVIPRPAPVIVTGFILHIQYPNSASSNYFGSATRILNTPFFLQHDAHFQANFTLTLAANAVPHSVDSISFGSSPSFTFVSASPNPPVTIQPGTSLSFTVTCQAPNSDYTGPATLDLVTH